MRPLSCSPVFPATNFSRCKGEIVQTVFAALAGLVLAQILDPATAQQILAVITGFGG